MSHVIAFGAVSSLGRGRAAFAVPDVGEVAPSCFAPVPAYEAAGVRRSTAALIALSPADRALDAGPVLLDLALTDCLAALDVARPQWRTERVGLVIGTSSGGVDASTQVFRALAAGRPPPRAAVAACTYASGFSQAAASLGVPLAREASVLVACASSTIALGLAHLWTATDACDVVLAGGYDGLSLFVSSGFSSLAAGDTPRPEFNSPRLPPSNRSPSPAPAPPASPSPTSHSCTAPIPAALS